MNLRVRKLIASFSSHQIDALLVTHDPNITYLTDFPASESWLLVTPKKCFYITDFRYILEAKKGLKGGVQLVQYQKSFGDSLFELTSSLNIKRLGFDARHLSVAMFHVLTKKAPADLKLVDSQNLVEVLREIKDADEIAKIKDALKLHKKTLQWLKNVVKVGATERQIFLKLESFVKAKGAGFSFSPIIASGPNSCYPHAKVTERKLLKNEPVLIDTGMDIKGYKSDLTRMFFLGKMQPLVTKVNEIVRQAQLVAIAKIKEGVSVADVDREARNYLARHKLDQYFGHSLGHGVGLEIHESPRLSEKSQAILKAGMVVTVEPAVYIPNKFGIRIEDMVLVKKEKGEVLSGDID